jgi:hypothetical protein
MKKNNCGKILFTKKMEASYEQIIMSEFAKK